MTTSVASRPARTTPVELPAVVHQLRWESTGVVSVELGHAHGEPLPEWSPGAHIELVLPTGIARQYSLCGDPENRARYRIGVLRERTSRGGSEYVHAFLRPGQSIRLRPPRNNFRLEPAPSYLFAAGGIGITPILPMVRDAEARGVPWRLLYGGRHTASMAFLDELRGYGDHVRLYPKDTVGRIPLDDWLGEPEPETDVYACGPEPLLAGVEQAMTSWRPGALHVERFRARPRQPREDRPFDVECARSGRTVTVSSERSILDTLQENGIPIEGSCRDGICGTCDTRVLDGTPEHRDDILSDKERAAGDRMFVCVSRAHGERLVLDV